MSSAPLMDEELDEIEARFTSLPPTSSRRSCGLRLVTEIRRLWDDIDTYEHNHEVLTQGLQSACTARDQLQQQVLWLQQEVRRADVDSGQLQLTVQQLQQMYHRADADRGRFQQVIHRLQQELRRTSPRNVSFASHLFSKVCLITFNHRQRLALWVGVGCFCLCLAFPPWVQVSHSGNVRVTEPAGHAPLFMPPNRPRVAVDYGRMLLYIALGVIVSGGAVLALADEWSFPRESDEPSSFSVNGSGTVLGGSQPPDGADAAGGR